MRLSVRRAGLVAPEARQIECSVPLSCFRDLSLTDSLLPHEKIMLFSKSQYLIFSLRAPLWSEKALHFLLGGFPVRISLLRAELSVLPTFPARNEWGRGDYNFPRSFRRAHSSKNRGKGFFLLSVPFECEFPLRLLRFPFVFLPAAFPILRGLRCGRTVRSAFPQRRIERKWSLLLFLLTLSEMTRVRDVFRRVLFEGWQAYFVFQRVPLAKYGVRIVFLPILLPGKR